MDDRYASMKAREAADMPRVDYMKSQPHLNAEMRKILVGWMAEAVTTFNLLPEVLALAVRLLDMTLSRRQARRKSAQTIGTAALALASKFHEDTRAPFVGDWEWVSGDECSCQQIADMERKIVALLDYNMTTPTAFDFAHEVAAMAGVTEAPESALYTIELSLLSYDALRFTPSLIAAASLHLANKDLDVERCSGYSADDLAPCIAVLTELPDNDKIRARHPNVIKE